VNFLRDLVIEISRNQVMLTYPTADPIPREARQLLHGKEVF
jgi:hypothetical protein